MRLATWTVGLSLLTAAPASGATVEAVLPDEFGDAGVSFRAAPREINNVVVSRHRSSIRVTDRTSPLRPARPAFALDAARCDTRGPHTVVCRLPHASYVELDISLGGLADRLDLDLDDTDAAWADGGTGDDVLTGGDEEDHLTGGLGADVIVGGRGSDGLVGGPGSDRLLGGNGFDSLSADGGLGVVSGTWTDAPDLIGGDLLGAPGHDLLDGGPGRDLASYGDRRRPVRVDLKRGIGGQRLEHDRLRSVEAAITGPADDVLIGNEQDNYFLPGGGDDRILGGGGDDQIDLRAGPELRSDRGRDLVRCGGGRDEVTRSNRRDTLARDCEAHVRVLSLGG